VEAVSLMISKWATTQFSLTISESTGVGVLVNPASPLEVVSLMISKSAPSQFSLTFSESTGAVGADLWEVLVMISESVATEFLLTIYESIGVVFAEESTCHLWKRFC
jgi:hypothetical protein